MPTANLPLQQPGSSTSLNLRRPRLRRNQTKYLITRRTVRWRFWSATSPKCELQCMMCTVLSSRLVLWQDKVGRIFVSFPLAPPIPATPWNWLYTYRQQIITNFKVPVHINIMYVLFSNIFCSKANDALNRLLYSTPSDISISECSFETPSFALPPSDDKMNLRVRCKGKVHKYEVNKVSHLDMILGVHPISFCTCSLILYLK